jgi:nucleotide-binding universal stress UspA family protein
MPYKTILVQGGVDAEAPNRVKAALSVGALFGAAVIGCGAEAWAPNVQPDFAFVDPATVQAVRDALDANLRAAEAEFDKHCAAYPHPHAWKACIAYPAAAMNQMARGADLIVAGRPRHGDTDRTFASPGELVMGSGLPVLVMPPGAAALRPDTVLVAWKDTREARRALADAIPFLQRAKKVLFFQVRHGEAESREDHQHAVLERLQRHGVTATPLVRLAGDLTVGEQIVEAALAHQADLIVTGAYGHSRLREWAFGGVTRTLLDDSPKPVLFGR